MKFKVLIGTVIFVFSLLPGELFAQDKVVVIPLIETVGPKVPTVTSGTGRVWMDRNLGAYRVAESATGSKAYGHLFQWGRLADGHELRYGPTTTTQSNGNEPVDGKFIIDHDDWRATPNNSLWQGANGINNPCPEGFRIPTYAEWQDELDEWVPKIARGGYLSPLKVPLAAFRSFTDGGVGAVEGEVFYWSADPKVGTGDAYFVSAEKTKWDGYSNSRAYGMSIRCIRN